MPKGIYTREPRVNTLTAEVCRQCKLAVCNDQAAGCGLAKLMRVWEGRDYERRKDYHAKYYAANRERKLQAAKLRQSRQKLTTGEGVG